MTGPNLDRVWGPAVREPNVRVLDARHAVVNPELEGTDVISSREAAYALDVAAGLASARARSGRAATVITIDDEARLSVATPSSAKGTILAMVDRTGKLSNPVDLTFVQGMLNTVRLQHGQPLSPQQEREFVTRQAARTSVVAYMPTVAVKGTLIEPDASQAVMPAVDGDRSPVCAPEPAPTASLPAMSAEGALGASFAAYGDKEALLYVQTLRQTYGAAAAAIEDKLQAMLQTDYGTLGSRRDKGINAYLLVKSALHDVAHPANVAQQQVGSCAAAVEQLKLAHDDPMQYLNVLHGLAGEEKAALPNGDVMAANFSYLASVNRGDDRSLSSKLMQNALMAYGQQNPGYDSDDHLQDGLESAQVQRVHDALFPHEQARVVDVDGPKSRRMAWEGLTEAVAKGHYVGVGLRYGKDGTRDALHEVLVTAVTAKRVVYVNPWGRLESMPKLQFRSALTAATLPALSPPP